MKLLETIGLNATDVKLLLAIRNGYHRQERIAKAIHVAQPTISRRIEKLLENGLLLHSKEEGLTLPLGWQGTIQRLQDDADKLNVEIRAALQSLRLAKFSEEIGGPIEGEQENDPDLPL